jgi:molybdopterin/thiamine biosynthesis adenylyltransferase
MNERFARHTLIAGWEQTRLSTATAVIMGMGALGNEVARILAMSGVGRLILCDYDRISISNLSRCVLFRETDVGHLKVEVAAKALTELVPNIQIETRPKPLIQGVGLAELREASIVLGCLDSRAGRLQLAGRCNLVKAPFIDGGTHPWGGEVRPYLDSEGPCYGCSLSPEERAVTDVPWSCGDEPAEIAVGATVSSSVVVSAWMSLVAIRFLMNLSVPQGTLSIDGSRGLSRIVQQPRDRDCLLHYPIDFTKKIAISCQNTVAELRRVLGAEKIPLVWAPVQQRVECRQCGFQELRSGLPLKAACPQCGVSLDLHTTLELHQVAGGLKLADLGIAPREILAVRAVNGLAWVELSG